MNSRNLLAAIVLSLAIPLALAQATWDLALFHFVVDGAVLIAWLLGSFGWGSLIVQATNRFPPPPLGERAGVRGDPSQANPLRPLQIATSISIGIGILSLLTLALGLLGWLNSITSWTLLAAGLLFALLHAIRTRPKFSHANRTILLPAAIVGFWLFCSLIPPGFLWGDEPNGYDVTEYHLQIPREWNEAGKIIPLHHNAFSFFPQNVEMNFLLAMHLRGGPWNGMYLAQMMSVAMMGIAALALYGIAKMLALRGAKWIAITFMLIPWTMLLAPIAYNEAGMLMFGTVALGWIILEIRRSPLTLALSPAGRGGVIIAAIATGLACGTKLTAGPMLLVPLLILLLLARRWRSSILFLITSLLVLSPWLIRNYLWAGNPVFPEMMHVFGRGEFSPLQQTRWEIAHHAVAGQSHLLALWQQILFASEFAWVLIPLALVSLRNRQSRKLAIVLLIQLIFWVCFTHLQGRFFVMAIPVMMLMIALAEFPPIIFGVLALTSVIAFVPRVPTAMKFASTVGITNFTGIHDKIDELPTDQKLVLIGDAKAFFYQRPIAYRTVFDVDNAHLDLIDAWADGARGTYIIDPNELRRFARTYYGIPPFADDHDAPYVLKH